MNYKENILTKHNNHQKAFNFAKKIMLMQKSGSVKLLSVKVLDNPLPPLRKNPLKVFEWFPRKWKRKNSTNVLTAFNLSGRALDNVSQQ